MNGGTSSAAPVMSWHARAAGCCTAALAGRSRRICWDGAKGWYRTAARTVWNDGAMTGTRREVVSGSTLGRWPNTALQRIAARWRFGMKPKGRGWAARAEGGR